MAAGSTSVAVSGAEQHRCLGLRHEPEARERHVPPPVLHPRRGLLRHGQGREPRAVPRRQPAGDGQRQPRRGAAADGHRRRLVVRAARDEGAARGAGEDPRLPRRALPDGAAGGGGAPVASGDCRRHQALQCQGGLGLLPLEPGVLLPRRHGRELPLRAARRGRGPGPGRGPRGRGPGGEPHGLRGPVALPQRAHEAALRQGAGRLLRGPRQHLGPGRAEAAPLPVPRAGQPPQV
mmetsp:Transcript_50209/g.160754  ORF Transcript_50209/g.160754 Transcript_50209/m.160754 type:complete len:235 (+) Transcript_50209:237-941(+)